MSVKGSSDEGPPIPSGNEQPRSFRLGFLISDGAATCLAVQEAIDRGDLPGCCIAIVICNITGAPGAEAARAAGLRTVTLEGRGHEQREHEEALDALLRRMGVELVCLSGYLRVLSRDFLRRWPGGVLTLHQSLLPAFPGSRPERQALDYGVQITGCTVALIDDSVDAMGGGAVVVQRAVQIAEDETEFSLRQRLAPEEDDAYVEAIRRVASEEYEFVGRRYLPRAASRRAPAVASASSASPGLASGTAENRATGSGTRR